METMGCRQKAVGSGRKDLRRSKLAISWVWIISLLLLIPTESTYADETLKLGVFSLQATALWENIWVHGKPPSTVTVPSPDGKKIITAVFDEKTDRVLLKITFGAKRFTADVDGGVGSEIAWSPDSQAFFLTWSSEGQSGEFHTRIYYVTRLGLKMIDLNPLVNRAFGHSVLCEGGPGPANVAAIAWLEGSRRILVAAEVPPLTICDSYGIFKAFEVSVPDSIVIKHYDQLAAKKEFWSYLGPRLREAPDRCITDPESCEVPNNHDRSN